VPEGLTILQVIPRMRAGGAELGCLQIAEALVKAGNRAIVVSQGGHWSRGCVPSVPNTSRCRLRPKTR
jgi:hypothetical protein